MLKNSLELKEMYKLKILKLKHFVTLQNTLFINDGLVKEKITFNCTFKELKTNQFHNARSIDAHYLKWRGFKKEKLSHFFTLNKCLSDCNVIQNALKTN